MPLEYSKQLCSYWRDTYDWRSKECYFKSFDQYITEIEGLDKPAKSMFVKELSVLFLHQAETPV